MPPTLGDSLSGILIQPLRTTDIMRLRASVRFQKVLDVLYLFDDRLFSQVIVVMERRSSGQWVVIKKPFFHVSGTPVRQLEPSWRPYRSS